jgi:hypothetical protein
MGCKGNVCEKDTGDCTDGCTLDRIIGDKCDICPAGFYHKNNNMPCFVGYNNQQCERG